VFIIFNKIHQNSILKIVIFYCHVLYLTFSVYFLLTISNLHKVKKNLF